MISKPVFLQGIYEFMGSGADKPALLAPNLSMKTGAGASGQSVLLLLVGRRVASCCR
jgi:hypothetical protein